MIHAVHGNDIGKMGGLARRMPLTTGAFVVGALALAGIPGLSGFFSKDLVLEAVEGKLASVPWAALLFTAFLTAFYMGRVVAVAFLGPPSTPEAAQAHEPGWSMRGPLVVLAVASMGGGLLVGSFARAYGRTYHLEMGLGPSIAAVLAVAGFALAYLVYGRRPASAAAPAPVAWVESLARTHALDRLYEGGYRRVTLRVADALGWIDRYVVDGAINAIGYGTLEAGARGRRMQTGLAPDYVLAAMLGVVGLAAWAVMR